MSKLKSLKHNFDKITSNHAQDWQLVLFWILLFEIVSSLFEYFFVGGSSLFIVPMPDSIGKEFFIGVYIAVFTWGCIYNFIFWNKINLLWLILLGTTGAYFYVTNDFALNFLLHNLFPIHYLRASFSFALIIELFFKLLITYLIYQLVKSLQYKNVE
ncbi:MAG: hypothetical protein ACNI3C_01535 [Candidatus Marinarcus sp.]|uniref:hypothetical protein n=1 Tax=Candidatus Marinarcus sp. TaxID=3100987 RepID=UPI003B009EE0